MGSNIKVNETMMDTTLQLEEYTKKWYCCLFLESNVTRNSLLRFNYFQCFFKIKYETLERRSNFFFMYTKSKTFFSTIFIFTFSKMYFYIFSHSTKKWKLFFLMNVFFSSSNYFMMQCVDYFYYE